MAGSLRMFVATLLPLLVCFTTHSDHTTHYVKPTANTPCPADPCLTLSKYAKRTHHYLTSNTTLVFLPGDHVLSVNFTVENVNDLGIYAQQTSTADNYTARIVCQGLVGFTYRNISHMTVHGLTFNSCGKSAVGHRNYYHHDYLTTYGVSVYLGQYINILNCTFEDSIGTALGVFYSSLVLKGRNSFTSNCRGCSDINDTCVCVGGGIHIYTSTLNFEAENSTFTNNSAEYGGGIYASQSTLKFTGNTAFINNSAEMSGGGIWASDSSFKFTGNSTFQSNSAEENGGGICATYSYFSGNRANVAQEIRGGIAATYNTLNFSDYTTFRDNSAGYSGGGIGAEYSALNFIGNCKFTNNSGKRLGGGIDAWTSALNFRGNAVFTSNSAEKYGGGIGAQYSTLNFSGNPIFTSNSAEKYYGGGIVAMYSTLNFIGNSAFTNNSGKQHGGGIHAWTSTLNFRGNTIFTSNSAEKYGGGIGAMYSTLNFIGNSTFTNNSGKQLGGRIDALTSTLNFSDNASNSAEKCGGGIVAMYSTLNFIGNSTFTNNSGKQLGGGLHVVTSTLNFRGDTIFTNNSAEINGGGIGAMYSTLKFTGNTNFSSNIAVQIGGGIEVLYSNLKFNGDTAFRSNSAGQSGGGIGTMYSNLNFNGDTDFRNNSAEQLGGGIGASHSTLNFTGNTTFKQNSVDSFHGGGVNILNSTLNFIGNTMYRNNSAKQKGGGISMFYSTLSFTGITTFIGNQAIIGGGIYTIKCILDISRYKITGKDSRGYNSFTLVFMGNSALIHGGAVNTKDSILISEGHNTFSGNSAQHYGGGIYSENSTLKFSGNTSFSSNSGQFHGGAIYGHAARIYFSGNNSFTANTAARGGGEYLVDSLNFLFPNTVVTMDSNNATEYGGAVYVEDSDSLSYCFPLTYRFVRCFFQVYGTVEPQITFLPSFDLKLALRASLNISLYFCNNHAGMSGSAIYGGSIDNCVVHVEFEFSKGRLKTSHDTVIDVLNMKMQQEPNSISSYPLQVCICEDGIANCSTREITRQVYPGEVLHFPAIVTGQRGGVVPAVVRAFFSETQGNTSLAQFQDTQNVKTDCTDLYYQMRSSVVNKTAMLVLYADGPCATDGKLLNSSLQFLPCPTGFSLNSSEMICWCEPRLQQYTTRCNITERTLAREGEFWVGYDNRSQVLILHPHCPFDYCKPGSDCVTFSLNNSDLQCETGRSGLLCGKCKLGLSLALGSSKCIQCSNVHILLFFPFLLAGIALVLLLLICKLTVAAGTINGLIFYANIVTVNHAIFLPPNQTNFLTVFIAWLNLDIGIETCFFDGMDAYIKTWLQFIFPLYIWSLVALVIIASYYSSRIGRLFGTNPVAVLATLFLLSYAKLLRTIITSLFFTFVNYPNDVQVAVWLYDGNVQYLHGKHTALFLVALLTLLILFLPYTLLLTVGQWLQASSNRRCFRWINNPSIKPFLDAYHAPYRDQHRYWTGLLVCLRCALLLVFAFNTQADPSLNLLVIGTVVIGLLILTHFTGLLYKTLYLDILEMSYILNLGILAIATYYVKFAVVSVSQAAVAYTSVGIAFATFIGVLLYHIYRQVCPKLQHKINQLRHSGVREMSHDNSSDPEDEADVYHEVQTLTAPTMTVVERPSPEPHDLTDNTSMKARSLSIASSSNLIEFRDPLDLINPDNSKSQPLILPTMNFTELRKPLDLIDTDDI